MDRLGEVDSTQAVVHGWLAAGVREVAVAVADVQTAGRGRLDRSWSAPSGTALLLSAGFRPTGLAATHAWRLAATVALSMLEAGEAAAGRSERVLWLKWPNDLVALGPDGRPLKLAGVLGETVFGPSGSVVKAVVGIGVNADWAAADFPPELAPSMTSLREVSGGRRVDRDALLEGFLARLEPRYVALREGRFDVGGWSSRQLTTGRRVEVVAGAERLAGIALGVAPESGALRLELPGGAVREVDSGEVTRCRVV